MYRRALLIAFVCAVATVSLFVLYLRRFEQESSGGERVRVLVALRVLERGSTLTEDALGVREIPRAYLEDRAIREVDKNKVLGLRSGGLVQAQQTILWTDLAVAGEDHRDLSSLVQPGRRAMALRLRNDMAGAMIRPGDYVDVIEVGMAAGNADARSARVLLQRVLVLAVGRSMDAELTDESRSAPGQADLTVSVMLPEAQLLAIAGERSLLSVALRSPVDNQTASRVPDVTLAAASTDQGSLQAVAAARRGLPTEVRSELRQ